MNKHNWMDSNNGLGRLNNEKRTYTNKGITQEQRRNIEDSQKGKKDDLDSILDEINETSERFSD